MPTPLSSTLTYIFPALCHADSAMRPPLGVNLTALVMRLRMMVLNILESTYAQFSVREVTSSVCSLLRMSPPKSRPRFCSVLPTLTSSCLHSISSFLAFAHSRSRTISFWRVSADWCTSLKVFLYSSSASIFLLFSCSNVPTMANIGFFRSWAMTEMSRSLSCSTKRSSAFFSSNSWVRSLTFSCSSICSFFSRLMRRLRMVPISRASRREVPILNQMVCHHGGSTVICTSLTSADSSSPDR